MSQAVKLYVYDLSRGLARQLSLQLTGRQLNGIWHTSVVVFGKEIYYGHGIDVALPGTTHHGSPMQVIDLGATSIDEETFSEYLSEVRNHYTADKYHLLDFNCNSFTNDLVGFLTGGTIPSWIKDLPADFLSTPFGESLRPTIDSMYNRGPTQLPTPPSDTPTPSAYPLLQALASQAARPPAPTQCLTSPLQISTNPSSFNSLRSSHRAMIVFFTSETCIPCRSIKATFLEIAQSRTSGKNTRGRGAAFVEVDMGTGMGGVVAHEWGVNSTPTFLFFLDGQKIGELKGANAPELRSRVDLLLFEAFPNHPHISVPLPLLCALSLTPIKYTQTPASLDPVLSKLNCFIDEDIPSAASDAEIKNIKGALRSVIIPFLSKLDTAKAKPTTALPPAFVSELSKLTRRLLGDTGEGLKTPHLFPLIDLWRLAILDSRVASASSDITTAILQKVAQANDAPRPVILTTLRLLTNALATPSLSPGLLFPSDILTQPNASMESNSHSHAHSNTRTLLTNTLISSLLSEDTQVRTAAASLAFNLSAFKQKPLMEAARAGDRLTEGGGEEGVEEWEIEVVSALLEGIGREVQSEEVVHRLTASLALFIHLSPSYTSHIKPLLEVLQARKVLKGKLELKIITKKEVRGLIEEVAGLCPAT